jgi:hypothetical protein
MARWGHSEKDYLFWSEEFFEVQQRRRDALRRAIDEAPSTTLRAGSVDEIAFQFAKAFSFQVPQLTEGAISATVDETQVDVSGDPSLAFQYGGFERGAHNVPGIKATYFVPFTGASEMLKWKPSTFTTQIPSAEVAKDELRFRFVQAGVDVAATKKAFDEELSLVKKYLGWLASDAQTFNDSLATTASGLITARRRRLDSL